MLTLCALLDCRERLVACNYLGEGEGVRPLMRQLVDAPLLSARPVQRAAESLREHARSDNAQARAPTQKGRPVRTHAPPLLPSPTPAPRRRMRACDRCHASLPRAFAPPLPLWVGRCGRCGYGRATCCAS